MEGVVGSNATQSEVSPDPPSVSSEPQSKLKSGVWEFFVATEITVGGMIVKKNRCTICKRLMKGGSRAGTSHLKRHLEIHAKDQSKNGNTGQMQLKFGVDGSVQNFTYDAKVARKEIVDFIVRAELPFTFVERHDFNGMIQRAFCPQYKGISASTCKRDVMKQYDKEKKELMTIFENYDGKICLTSDIWSSRQKMGYMSLTAHFVDKEWSLNKRIICFKMIEYPHTGESLASHINEELLSWRIHNKVMSLSLDNASNNDVVASLLPNYLMIESELKKVFHVRCCAHILNLIVQDGLVLLSPSIDKITNIVRCMNSSNKRYELWLQCCVDFAMPKRNIDNDVPHRWNSTYDLLIVAIKYRAPLNRFVQKLSDMRSCNLALPTEYDWSIAQLVSGFLEIFSTSTKVFSGIYYPTSSRVIPCLVNIHATFNAYDGFFCFKDALDVMKMKFEKYWSEFPIAFCFAAIMDPRFKLFAIGEWLECIGLENFEVERKKLDLKTELFKLYEVYKRNVSSNAPTVIQTENVTCTTLSQVSGSISIPVVSNFSMQRLKRARTSTTASNSSDLQTYLELPTIEVNDDAQFSVLSWWKSNASIYPILSLMACDLLTIPASTVASESCFSAGGRVVSEKRASLSPNTVEALICLKDWKLAASRMQEAMLDEQHAEELMIIKSSRPDWMAASDDDVINADGDSGSESEVDPSSNA